MLKWILATVLLTGLSVSLLAGPPRRPGLRALPRTYYRAFVGVGPSLNLVLESANRQWVNQNTGLGFLQGFGGTIQGERPLTETISATLEAGYQHWQVKREYRRDGRQLATQYKRLGQIPVLVGAKLFFRQDWYVAPQLGLHSLALTEWSDSIPQKASRSALGGMAAVRLGREFPLRRGWLDVSAGYQYCPAKLEPASTDALHYVSLRAIWKIGFIKPINCPRY